MNGCPSNEFLNNYHNNLVKLQENPLPPSLELIFPTDKVTLCKDITISTINILNDGLRGVFNF